MALNDLFTNHLQYLENAIDIHLKELASTKDMITKLNEMHPLTLEILESFDVQPHKEYDSIVEHSSRVKTMSLAEKLNVLVYKHMFNNKMENITNE